ncbi:MAG: metallopeptidase family protein [Gammaproteobacteria bacterium]
MTALTEWRDAVAPDLAVFQALAASVWEKLPGQFRHMCGDVVIRVNDFATDEVLDELDIESPFDLLGLYQGVSLPQKSAADVPREPDMVYLYRRAILDEWSNGDDSLGAIVAHVLIHEIGHHFGFSDVDMEEIESDVIDEL